MDILKLIVELAVTLLIALVAKYVIPMIQSRTTQQEQEQLLELVDAAVRAAEQTFGAGTGETKKQWVLDWLKNVGVDDTSNEIVDALVESAVYDMNLENGDSAQ